ncbi:hypothetical protein RQM47_04360 [Rubrivirga sp. S365]|uniref:Uncharacterized protein n=1 Tax=Rubrivirga litoralis TaxID=3075598 RepID=A0ABU3BM63_9BACT|nr:MULTISPECIES: hypothetical protein [unclassified Rubrivirga]MDT0630355.1 hypothetical protein [Rubrivirga sp. F394]MDT7855866.1 hypothetical protein [Rubrivirga sp. S365]
MSLPVPPGALARIVRFVATGAVVATLVLIVVTADGRPWQALASVVMIALLPYVAFVALARWANGVPWAEAAVLAGLVLAVFFAAAMYVLAFVVAPGPKSASAPLAVPLLQSFAVALGGVGAGAAKWAAWQAGRGA